jgi:TPR repeat protein
MRSAQVTQVVAKALVNGDGVAQDHVLAAEWYEKAAAAGDIESRHRLGKMYFHGQEGVEQDLECAVAEFRRAAEEGEEGGHAPAQRFLADCYYDGDRVEKDYVHAREWYKKAALGGDPDAIYDAAEMCLNGEGGEPDFEYAARMFHKLAKNGNGQAQNQLGCMYLKGDGVAQDDMQAVAWFGKSADNEISEGQANLAYCHLKGWGVERDAFEAGRLFRLAALQRDAKAQWYLGEIFRKGELYCGAKMKLARKYLRLAAEQGNDDASARLEEMDRERLHCALCGADDAPSECALCHWVRYCNLECSHEHWRHGGGFQFPARGAAEDPHEDTCKRTYGRSGQ